MNRPGSYPLKIDLAIEAVFEKIAAHFDDERRFREEFGYADLEQTALCEALQLVVEHPSAKRQAWKCMSDAVQQANLDMAKVHAPPLRCVSYETFLSLLRNEARLPEAL